MIWILVIIVLQCLIIGVIIAYMDYLKQARDKEWANILEEHEKRINAQHEKEIKKNRI